MVELFCIPRGTTFIDYECLFKVSPSEDRSGIRSTNFSPTFLQLYRSLSHISTSVIFSRLHIDTPITDSCTDSPIMLNSSRCHCLSSIFMCPSFLVGYCIRKHPLLGQAYHTGWQSLRKRRSLRSTGQSDGGLRQWQWFRNSSSDLSSAKNQRFSGYQECVESFPLREQQRFQESRSGCSGSSHLSDSRVLTKEFLSICNMANSKTYSLEVIATAGDMQHPHSDPEQTIIRLKQQVHQAFMQVAGSLTQINQMERLFAIEIEHAKQELQERERELEQRESQMTNQQQSLTDRLKQCHYLEGMSELDDASIPDIPFVDQSGRDSTIFVLLKEAQSLTSNDPDGTLTQLRELHRAVQGLLNSPVAQLNKLFSIACENCLENYRLREELQNRNQRMEVLERKLEELSTFLISQHNTTSQLKRLNEQLKVANTDLEAIGRIREIDLLEKKRECDVLRKQNHRLQQAMRNQSQQTNENSGATAPKSVLLQSKLNLPRQQPVAKLSQNGSSKPAKSIGDSPSYPLRTRMSLQSSMPLPSNFEQSLERQQK